jgi:hypothetical protein
MNRSSCPAACQRRRCTKCSGAMHHLGRLRHPAIQRLAALDRLEAASRAGGRTGQIRTWTGELAQFAEDTGAAWAAAIAAYGRALIAADSGTTDPEPHFLQAMAEHSQASRPVAQARTQLAYGEFLRRSRRRVDARAQLRAALDVFTEAGALPWADRAPGTTCLRRDRPATRSLGLTAADPARAAGRLPGQPRELQCRRGRSAVPEPADRGVPPEERLPETRCPLPR